MTHREWELYYSPPAQYGPSEGVLRRTGYDGDDINLECSFGQMQIVRRINFLEQLIVDFLFTRDGDKLDEMRPPYDSEWINCIFCGTFTPYELESHKDCPYAKAVQWYDSLPKVEDEV